MPHMKVFFLHNPKAGGSSVRAALRSFFPDDKIAPTFLNAPNDTRAGLPLEAELRNYDFFAGHYGFNIYEKFGEKYSIITNFRNPVRRITSLYRYWRNNVSLDVLSGIHESDAQVVRWAHTLEFSDFIRVDDENLRLYIENFHFRQIFQSGWEWCDLDPTNIAIVRDRISKMEWFYIAELPTTSLALFREFVGYRNFEDIPYENMSVGGEIELSIRDQEYLLGINTLDLEIYALAISLQRDRFEVLERASAS